MRKVLIIARYEYLVNVRRAGFIFMTAMFPLLGLIVLIVGGFFVSSTVGTMVEDMQREAEKRIGLVDHDGRFVPVPPEYEDRFQVFDGEGAGRIALEHETISALAVIEADYLTTGHIVLILPDATEGLAGFSRYPLTSAVEAMMLDTLLTQAIEDTALRERVENPADWEYTTLHAPEPQPTQPEVSGSAIDALPESSTDSSSWLVEGAGTLFNFVVPYFFSFLLFLSVFASSGYLMRGISEEKTNRVIEIILSSVTARELLTGKILGLGALGLTQVVIWLASTVILTGGVAGVMGIAMPLLTRPDIMILCVVYYILGFLLYAVLMGAGGSLGTTMEESQQMAGLTSLVAVLPMMLSGFMFTDPNMTLARVLSWIPLTGPTMMMMRLPYAEVPLIDIIGSLLTLGITIPLIVLAGAKVFRAGLLMYGKRPTPRDIWRILKEA